MPETPRLTDPEIAEIRRRRPSARVARLRGNVSNGRGRSPVRTDGPRAKLEKRFAAIRAENGLLGMSADQFAERAAEHLSELNAIHPFREGNGRTLRAFLGILAERAGHEIDMTLIDPKAWKKPRTKASAPATAG